MEPPWNDIWNWIPVFLFAIEVGEISQEKPIYIHVVIQSCTIHVSIRKVPLYLVLSLSLPIYIYIHTI